MNLVSFALSMNFDEKEKGTSGGDRILVNFIKRLINKDINIYIYTTKEGYMQLKYYNVPSSLIQVIPTKFNSWVFKEIERVFKSISLGIRFKTEQPIILYSASNFIADILSAFLIKFRARNKAKWVVGFWMFPPSPFSKGFPYKGKYAIRGILYFLNVYLPFLACYRLVDGFWVTNPVDMRIISSIYGVDSSKILVVKGGVDKASCLESISKVYDAIFVGRLHPQKGVLQLIDIWQIVCKEKPYAKLVIVGVGPLYEDLRKKIRRLNLQDNIYLVGFKDGQEKMQVIANSKIFLHPVIYDSGGMAAAEAMVCGLPCVTFDLPTIREYYAYGCIRIKPYDLKAFAAAILNLLNDQILYQNLSKEAKEYCEKWDWSYRAKEALEFLRGI